MTGATGLIGKEIGRRMAAAGHEITVVSRNPARARRELPFPAKIFAWKGETEAFPVAALDGQEAVINLAGESIVGARWNAKTKEKIRKSRIVGTQRLVEAILASPEEASSLRVFVHGSAVGIYGNRGDEILIEESSRGDGFLSDVVESWELETEPLKQLGKVRIVKVRTGVVLSRRGGALAKMLGLFARGLGGQLGKGGQWMSWIHIEDIARLFSFCVESGRVSGVVNGVAPEPARNERFTIELARALGQPVSLPAPEVALKLIFGEMSSALLDSQRASPQQALDLGFQFHFPDLVGALRELGEPLREFQHELVSEQWLSAPPEEVFSFFSNENNLEVITPAHIGFHVLSKNTPEIGEGTLINYRLKIHGVPTKWRTRIEQWQPNKCFVDTQDLGPYRYWHHTHEFIEFCGGTLMRDRVHFKLPLGFLGDAIAGWFVVRDVERIFAYRRQKIDEIFSKSN
jgi:uncharacterized protein (TIGR01777 family)